MAIKHTYVCDRCGCEIGSYIFDLETSVKGKNWCVLDVLKKYHDGSAREEKKHLCVNCVKSFNRWVSGAKVVDEPDEKPGEAAAPLGARTKEAEVDA